ncbi:hypothetical protein LXL04_028084 [Taraxacum kok-saghyz]
MATCSCGCEAVIRTSTTRNNPGRPFYACPKKGPRSGFIRWVEETKISPEALMIARLVKGNRILEKENLMLKIGLVCSWLIFLGIIVYKL